MFLEIACHETYCYVVLVQRSFYWRPYNAKQTLGLVFYKAWKGQDGDAQDIYLYLYISMYIYRLGDAVKNVF